MVYRAYIYIYIYIHTMHIRCLRACEWCIDGVTLQWTYSPTLIGNKLDRSTAVSINDSHLVLEIVQLVAQITELSFQTDALLLGVDRVHSLASGIRFELLDLFASTTARRRHE